MEQKTPTGRTVCQLIVPNAKKKKVRRYPDVEYLWLSEPRGLINVFQVSSSSIFLVDRGIFILPV